MGHGRRPRPSLERVLGAPGLARPVCDGELRAVQVRRELQRQPPRLLPHGGADAIPVTMVALRESETTDNDPSFRRLRTLPIDPAVCGESSVYMPAHIKIVPGGSPAPRIYFHDDTSGATGKIHIGYFGDHLDNNAKS